VGGDDIDDQVTVFSELFLNGALVLRERVNEFGVFWVLLDGLDGAAGGSLGGDQVLKGNGEQVSLVGAHLGTLFLQNVFKEIDHIVESLGLLSDAGKEDVLFNTHIQTYCFNNS